MSWGTGRPWCSSTPVPGLDGSIFLPGAEALAATHRLLLVDLPGNGRSPDPEEWTLAAHARALEDLVRERGLEDWTLLGHSFGGFVSMQHLIDFPGSASRLIASCTDADEEDAPGAPEDAYDNLPPDVEAAFQLEERVTSDEEAREAWLGQLPFFAPTPEGVEAVRDGVRRRRLPPPGGAPRGRRRRAARADRARDVARSRSSRSPASTTRAPRRGRGAPDRRHGAARRPRGDRRRRALPVRRAAGGVLVGRSRLARANVNGGWVGSGPSSVGATCSLTRAHPARLRLVGARRRGATPPGD